MTLLPMLANAHDFEVNGLCYNLVSLDDKVVCLTSNPDGYSGDIVIPSTITVGDYTFKVDSIGDNACAYCYGLNSITIEEGVKKIGKRAFYSVEWNKVEYIKLPKSLEYIGPDAFECMVPLKVYIADLTSWCNIVIDSYPTAGNPLDLNINMLKTFGKNVCQIFINNERIYDLKIPDGVEKVNDLTFKGSNLSSVTFSNSVKYVSGFKDSYIEKAILGDKTETIALAAFKECKYLKTTHLPNSVTSVLDWAFMECTSLEDLILGEGITTIANRAFYGCTSIPAIIIKDNCKTIGPSAFQNCSKAKKLYLGSAVTTVDDSAFDGCANLDSIIVSATTPPSIAENTFSASVKLVSKLIVPNGCKEKYLQDPNWSTFNNIYEYDGNISDFANTKYLLSYVVDGETYKTYSLNYGDAVTPEPAPTKEGYTFSGWSDIPTTMPAHDVIITGSFTKNTKDKCANPTIKYENGKLYMECATDGVTYVTNIGVADAKQYYDATIQLSATYNISVYATKEGYDNSETVTATLCWIDAEPKTEGITNGVAEVRARAVLINSYGGLLTVEGINDGQIVDIYSLNGEKRGSAVGKNGAARIDTNVRPGSIVVVKMGEKSVKVIVK